MRFLLFFILCTTFLFASKNEVTVTILPQKYFVQKIVKDKFKINVMVPPGSSPHNFEPKPSQMKALFNSKLYFLIKEPSEEVWISKLKQNAKNTIFVDTTIGIKKIPMSEHKHHGHEEDEETLDPHIWLDPNLVKIQAKNIYEAILKIDGKNSDFYKSNYLEFIKELDSLDSDIKTILKPYKNRAFMVFHPSWGYFALQYDLQQIAIEIEGKEPKPSELIELINKAKELDIRALFVSKQFSQTTAKTISKDLKANIIIIDPLSEDFTNELLKIANELAKSYQ